MRERRGEREDVTKRERETDRQTEAIERGGERASERERGERERMS